MDGVQLKQCTRCAEWLPLTSYHRAGGKAAASGLQPHCKECDNERRRLRRSMAAPGDVAAYDRAQSLRQRYGITEADYDRMLSEQGGACAVCRAVNNGTPHQRRMHVDHCHQTGRVRGILCARCNLGIGYFSDNPETLRRASVYLEDA